MFRQAAVVTRLASNRRLVQAGSRRWNSSNASGTSTPSSKLPWAIGAVAVTGGGIYFASGSTKTTAVGSKLGQGTQVPTIQQPTSEAEISVTSPVKVVSLKEANERLREQANTFVFDSKDGSKGRVDLVRFNSNMPVEDEWALSVGKGIGGATTLFAGVYDGHAGWATSAVLRQALIPYVSTSLVKLDQSSSGDLVDTAIKNAFVRLDDRITANAKEAAASSTEQGSADVISAIAPAIAGSCALLTMYDVKSSTLRTAVTGDSRAVLGSWSPETGNFSADPVSKDQTGFNQDEVDKLDKAHPGEKDVILDPKSGRLMGFAITRAFGDHRLKWTADSIKELQSNFFGFGTLKQESKTPPYMIATPEVTTRQVKSEDFVILGSDGLWDCISSDDAVACVSRWLAAKRAGKPEAVTEASTTLKVGDHGWPEWKATPEYFAIEDLDSAAICLVKNAFGGNRRGLFCGVMSLASPMSRYVRDDITVQVIFFKDPYTAERK
ncbi:Pyruvate dehydrogenase (Lipoamide) phosphatase C10F6.17c [Cladobotryum mycophilum]|uniref:Pyruvate dehydrogenase (Lipoamide) phosphatase C10F6.17c n=1 Tax=Cladobotryum mycophilum TaxID=491253 RepID=A0ABR0SX65_9HYPO